MFYMTDDYLDRGRGRKIQEDPRDIYLKENGVKDTYE